MSSPCYQCHTENCLTIGPNLKPSFSYFLDTLDLKVYVLAVIHRHALFSFVFLSSEWAFRVFSGVLKVEQRSQFKDAFHT